MSNSKRVKLDIPNFSFKLTLETHGNNDLVSRMIQTDKVWEAYETQLMIEHVKKGDCVLDIGANIGYYSLIASKLVGEQGKIFSFEPEAENFFLLSKNIALNQLNNVQGFQAGLGNRTETISFFRSENNRGDHRAFNEEGTRKESFVDILIGDETINTQRVDFIKIDTQGFELAILQGLRKTLSENQKHLKMVVEFWPFALEKNGASASALVDELARYDFDIYIIDHINYQLVNCNLAKLKYLGLNDLAPENQGFINIWLSPKKS